MQFGGTTTPLPMTTTMRMWRATPYILANTPLGTDRGILFSNLNKNTLFHS